MLIDTFLDGVAARLDTIAGLTVTTNPLAMIVPPMALVYDGDITYDATFGKGFDSLSAVVVVYVSETASEEGVAQARLYKSGHGAKSIRLALETSIGVDDVIPNKSLRAVTGSIGEDGRPDLAKHIAIQITATSLIPGTE
jgi:hypothetical protein